MQIIAGLGSRPDTTDSSAFMNELSGTHGQRSRKIDYLAAMPEEARLVFANHTNLPVRGDVRFKSELVLRAREMCLIIRVYHACGRRHVYDLVFDLPFTGIRGDYTFSLEDLCVRFRHGNPLLLVSNNIIMRHGKLTLRREARVQFALELEYPGGMLRSSVPSDLQEAIFV